MGGDLEAMVICKPIGRIPGESKIPIFVFESNTLMFLNSSMSFLTEISFANLSLLFTLTIT